MGWGGQCGQLGHIPTGPAEAHSPEAEGARRLDTWSLTPLAGCLHQAAGLGGLWPAGGPCAPTTARTQPPGLGTPEEEAPGFVCFSVQRRKQCQPEATGLSEASAGGGNLRPLALGFWPPVGAPPSGGRVTLWPREIRRPSSSRCEFTGAGELVESQRPHQSQRAQSRVRAKGPEAGRRGPQPPRASPAWAGSSWEDTARAAGAQVAGAAAPTLSRCTVRAGTGPSSRRFWARTAALSSTRSR